MEEETILSFVGALPISIVMWVLIVLVVLGFCVYSAILIWHWRMYSTGKFTTMSNLLMYILVSLVFIALMIGSAIVYSFL